MNKLNELLTEKYRPKTLDDLVLKDNIKDYFRDPDNLKQNILLVGHSGIGKTTLAKIIVNDILDCQYIYINASDESGIDTIRHKVMNFVSSMSLDGKPKVVILDEGDGLSASAQQALRNSMEEFSEGGFFILTANFGHKIIEPLRSRCANFNLEYDYKDFIKHIAGILKKEGIEVDADVLEYVKGFYPDFRKCLNDLQKRRKDGKINLDAPSESDKFVDELIESITSKSIYNLRKFIIQHEPDFDGDYNVLAKFLFNRVCDMELAESVKAQTLMVIGECLRTHSQVEDVEINFFSKLIEIKILWMNNKKKN
jgi:replication factor C small subunit